MRFSDILRRVDGPILVTADLRDLPEVLDGPTGRKAALATLNRALVRWCHEGRLVQLRRGVYVIAERVKRDRPHAFEIANTLDPESYVSLASALAYHGQIGSVAGPVESVTPRASHCRATPYGEFRYFHIHPRLVYGYEVQHLVGGATVRVSTPEKACLDIAWLCRGLPSPFVSRWDCLADPACLDLDALCVLAGRSESRMLGRASGQIMYRALNTASGTNTPAHHPYASLLTYRREHATRVTL